MDWKPYSSFGLEDNSRLIDFLARTFAQILYNLRYKEILKNHANSKPSDLGMNLLYSASTLFQFLLYYRLIADLFNRGN